MTTPARPPIVTLCGPTRFRAEYRAANAALTGLGVIVLSCGIFKGDPEAGVAEKGALDRLHFEKIRMSDEIVVIGGRANAGESTRAEIALAEALGLRVTEFAANALTPRPLLALAADLRRIGGAAEHEERLLGDGADAYHAFLVQEVQIRARKAGEALHQLHTYLDRLALARPQEARA